MTNEASSGDFNLQLASVFVQKMTNSTTKMGFQAFRIVPSLWLNCCLIHSISLLSVPRCYPNPPRLHSGENHLIIDLTYTQNT